MRTNGAPASPSTRAFWAGLLAIVALAAMVRIVGLRDLPPGLFCDEAGNGYNSYLLLTTGRDESREFLPLYVWSFGVSYKNPVFIYAATVPIALFGLNEFSVRLTAACFGVLAVLGMGVLGRLVFGVAGGLIAALLLAVVPWHVHFSRIAFELIAFPAIFLFACAALVAGVRGRARWLLVAGPLFSLCLYTYGPAKMFVPLFLLGAVAVYARRLWALRRVTAAALLLAALTAVPVIIFDLQHRDRSSQYFSRTTTLSPTQTPRENAARVWDQYTRFFSRAFLFERGDPLARHAVPGFGELYWCMVPLLALGVLWCLWPGHPEGKLFLWWLLLYPIAPALMNEAPSASRGFIGVAAFCLVATAGAVAVLETLRRLLPWPRVALTLQLAAVAVLLVALGREALRYGRAYTTTYPTQAADDFQYGYRETIDFMEGQRDKYDLLLLTANRVNQPQIFAAFYNAQRPGGPPTVREHGYLIIDPSEYGRYEMNQRILAALREDDLRLFDDYTELHRVLTPAGRTEYVIAEPHNRRRFIRDWLLLGPFDNLNNAGVARSDVTPETVAARASDSVLGPAYWRRVVPQFVKIDLNAFYGRSAEAAGKPTEWLCAYAYTQIDATAAQPAWLELAAGQQPVQVWLNGATLVEKPIRIGSIPQRWPIQLNAGANQVLVKVCKATGEWSFTTRVTDAEGHDLPGISVRAELPAAPIEAQPEPPTQLVDGFGAPVRASRQSELYADYRGNSAAWWEALEDPNGAVVWKTDPVPARAPTVFAVTGTMSEQPGTAELWVNGQYALTFPTGQFKTPQRWQRGPYVLEFVPREQGNFLSGYFRLLVPAAQTTPGQPVELRVAHVSGSPFAFFQIKGRDDTVQFEKVTMEGLVMATGVREPVAHGAPSAGSGSDSGSGSGSGGANLPLPAQPAPGIQGSPPA
jgi:4-amino-4-deoxy-L-arabinose transferase-like glycosyltransferase